MNAPNAYSINRTSTAPLKTPRTMRRQTARTITSLPAGRMVPIGAFPLLREDAVRSGRLRLNFEMMETAEVLLNAVNVRVMAYLVPWLAMERFNGSMDQLNLSYEGKPPLEGEAVVPFFELTEFGDPEENDIHRYLGRHGREDQMVNTMYVEAYNQVWNFRAKNRSPDIELRARLNTDLAPAFWTHEQFRHIVPSVDLAAIDGEVPLNVTAGSMPVKGRDIEGNFTDRIRVRVSGSEAVRELAVQSGSTNVQVTGTAAGAGARLDFSEMFAEMEENGITVSLSNIEMARKTQAFAKLRQQYNMHDEHIISLLMDGIHIPDQAFKQPMLLADKRTVFGMAKRYASDGGNLTESVVNGATGLDLSIQVPRIGTGGVIMVVAEITPDQLFERQMDPFLHVQSVDELPHYLRDTLDPEKVDVVKCERIDVDHDTPNATFGYEPLNARWNVDIPSVGGRFYRPEVDASFDEDRLRIWAVEVENPTLSADFYLYPDGNHNKPFVVTNQDPFEVVVQGDVYIEGNTVFGSHLVEATDDYEEIMKIVPQERISQE